MTVENGKLFLWNMGAKPADERLEYKREIEKHLTYRLMWPFIFSGSATWWERLNRRSSAMFGSLEELENDLKGSHINVSDQQEDPMIDFIVSSDPTYFFYKDEKFGEELKKSDKLMERYEAWWETLYGIRILTHNHAIDRLKGIKYIYEIPEDRIKQSNMCLAYMINYRYGKGLEDEDLARTLGILDKYLGFNMEHPKKEAVKIIKEIKKSGRKIKV